MRKLMWFSIGFGAACALRVYLIPEAAGLLLGLSLLIIGGILLCLRRRDWVRVAAFLCLGLAAGQILYGIYDRGYLATARSVDGQVMTVTLEAEDYSYDTDYGIAVDGTVKISGKRYHVRMYVDQYEPLNPGDQVTGDFRLRYTAPGGAEEATHHSGNGMLLLAYPKGEHTVVPAVQKSWRYIPAYLRMSILGIIEDAFPEDAVPFAKALLLGDTSELDYETDSDLSISGLRHVAAVSGLHVSILFSIVYLFAGKRRFFTVALGVPVLVLFAAMAGFSPSIMRAGIMQLLMLAAMAFKREYDPPTALSFAALVMLAANPLTVTSVGFQLSVASVAGIFLFCGRINSWLMDPKRLGRWKKGFLSKQLNKISASVSVSISALITTTPLTAWYFGKVSLFSAVTNLLCLWVITILFCGIILACILSAVWLPLGKIVAWVLAWLIRYVLAVSGFIAGIPLAAVYTQSVYVVAWLVFCYILLAVFLLSKQKRPVILSCCAVLTLCVALLASWTEPLLDDYRMTVLDVGQGQCILLQSHGRTYMVDCGGSYDEDAAETAAGFLLSQGIQRLDGLILSHYDKDHVGAAAYLLHRVKADVLILPEGDDAAQWDPLLLENHTGEVIRAKENIQITWADASITIYTSWMTHISNESSLCVLFQTEKCDILITGDRSTMGEEILLRSAALPQLDVLVAGHHGAASSTGEDLLQATQPATVVFSVGENSYGHPAQAVLDRVTALGCHIRRTDLEGTIIIRG